MVSLRQNQAHATSLTTFEVFSELIIQVLFCGEKFADILLKVVVE